MSDGISDMYRDEERKAAELVEKACKNCDHIKINMDSAYCFDCTNHSNFRPTQSAIDAKVEELRTKEAVAKRAGGFWRSPEEEPVGTNIVFVLYEDGAIDWLIEPNESLSLVKGYMYFSDLCNVLKLMPEMLDCLKALVKWNSKSPSNPILAINISEICEDAENIIKKAEGK